ncbi:MAG: ArgE/DapE family deacylase [Chloroflexota bacterium]
MATESTSELTRRIAEAVEALRPDLLEVASGLLRIPSVNPTFPGQEPGTPRDGELRANQYFAQACRQSGWQVDLWEQVPGRGNLVAVMPARGGGGRSLIMNGHIDTVPAGAHDRWPGGDPFSGKVDDGYLHGLGASDMKGPLATAFIAMRALAKAGIGLKGDLILQSVCGEEMEEPEVGTTAAVKRGYRADAAVVVEPSNLAIHPAGPHLDRFKLTVYGKTCHSTARYLFVHPSGDEEPVGVNAIEKAVYFINLFQQLEQEWGHTKRHPLFAPGQFTIHPGMITVPPEATSHPAVVADSCIVEFALRFPPNSDVAAERKEIEDFVYHASQLDTWLRAHPPKVEWVFHWPAADLDPEHPIVKGVAAAHATMHGAPPPITAFPAGTDASFLLAEGIPAAVYGPGELWLAHAVGERIRIEDMVTAAKTLALTAAEWCGLA